MTFPGDPAVQRMQSALSALGMTGPSKQRCSSCGRWTIDPSEFARQDRRLRDDGIECVGWFEPVRTFATGGVIEPSETATPKEATDG